MIKNIINKLKICEYLIKNLKLESYPREISRNCNLNISTTIKELNELLELNILDFKFIGKSKIFFLKNNINTINLLQQTENYKTFNFIEKNYKLKIILEELYNITNFIIFGSFSKYTNNKNSDLDIVIFSEPSEDIRRILGKLFIKVQPHFISVKEFQKLIQKNDFLSIEIMKSHICFGYEKEISLEIIKWAKSNGV